MAEQKETKLNLYQKMMKIAEEIGVIEKKGTVGTGSNKYKAVNEKDILEGIKPLEIKYGVFSYPSDRKILQTDILEKQTEYNGEIKTTRSQFMRIETTYKFINADNPEEQPIEIKSYGDGIDTGDKAPGKAMTYSDKYALMKAYKIATGEDPDAEHSPEDGYTASTRKASKKQIDMIDQHLDDLEDSGHEDAREKFMAREKIKSLEELTLTRASEIISKILENKKGK